MSKLDGDRATAIYDALEGMQGTIHHLAPETQKAVAGHLARALVAVPPTTADRDRIADAIRAAACPGDCGKTEEECAKERIQPFVWHHGRLAVVEGTPEQFADAVLAVLPAGSEDTTTTRADALRDFLWRLEQSAGDAAAEKFLDDNPELRRLAAETQRTPCGPVPDQCDADGEPCANHEREQAHAVGEHCFCGPECSS